jgi:hypothetical protein
VEQERPSVSGINSVPVEPDTVVWYTSHREKELLSLGYAADYATETFTVYTGERASERYS